jgi:hypothetical protein
LTGSSIFFDQKFCMTKRLMGLLIIKFNQS